MGMTGVLSAREVVVVSESRQSQRTFAVRCFLIYKQRKQKWLNFDDWFCTELVHHKHCSLYPSTMLLWVSAHISLCILPLSSYFAKERKGDLQKLASPSTTEDKKFPNPYSSHFCLLALCILKTVFLTTIFIFLQIIH